MRSIASDGSYVNDEGARVIQTGEIEKVIFDDGEAVDGELLKSNGEDINGRPPTVHNNMISLRTNFLRQLIGLSSDIF